jgi:hypothetical protein
VRFLHRGHQGRRDLILDAIADWPTGYSHFFALTEGKASWGRSAPRFTDMFKIIMDNAAKKNFVQPPDDGADFRCLTILHDSDEYWAGVVCAQGLISLQVSICGYLPP